MDAWTHRAFYYWIQSENFVLLGKKMRQHVSLLVGAASSHSVFSIIWEKLKQYLSYDIENSTFLWSYKCQSMCQSANGQHILCSLYWKVKKITTIGRICRAKNQSKNDLKGKMSKWPFICSQAWCFFPIDSPWLARENLCWLKMCCREEETHEIQSLHFKHDHKYVFNHGLWLVF